MFVYNVYLCFPWQEHLVKQGLKADQAASLVEMTAAKCSTLKYDVELAEEYIARQVMIITFFIIYCISCYWNNILYLFVFLSPGQSKSFSDFHLLKCGSKCRPSTSSVAFSSSYLYSGCSHLQSTSFFRWASVQSCNRDWRPQVIWYS